MFKKILILASSLLFISCGSSSSSSSRDSSIINGVKISTWMYQIQDLHDEEVEILAETDYDMLVVESGLNFKEKPYDTPQLISKLSKKSNGDKRVLIAYINIGQAEDYRDYWKDNWVAPTNESIGSPDFMITIDPDGWSGNYTVAYWDSRWKDIWLSERGIIYKLATQGFDGVYLDWIGAYNDKEVLKYAKSQNIDTEREMIDFIREIKEKGREINPNFTIISQNALYLLDYNVDEYASIIDGIAVEDTWFYGEGDSEWNDESAGDLPKDELLTTNSITQSSKYLNLGIPVFTIDYCISEDNADHVYSESRKNGFIPIVSRVSLSKLTETPPPEFRD